MKCLRRILAIPVAFLLFSTAGLTQDRSGPNVMPNSVYVGADGKYESAPDTALLQFHVFAQEETAQAAFEHASKNEEQVRQVLRSNGIDPKMATFGSLSVQPIYEWKPKQHVSGYRVSTDVTLKLKDFAKVGPITQQLADANVSESQTLTYTLDNTDEAKNKALENAYRRAHNSAETLARVSGRSLGELSYASVDTFEPPRVIMPHMARAMGAVAAAAPAPNEEFTPQTVTVTAHVNALFTLK